MGGRSSAWIARGVGVELPAMLGAALVACTSDPDEPASEGMSPARSAGYIFDIFLYGTIGAFIIGLSVWSARRSRRKR